MTIKYISPQFRNFGDEHTSRGLKPIVPSDEFQDRFGGLFVIIAKCDEEDAIQVLSLASASTHQQVVDEFKVTEKQRRVLGGGRIRLVLGKTKVAEVYRGERGGDGNKGVSLSSYSNDFGALPNLLLEEYFNHFGYAAYADMITTDRITESTEKWLKKYWYKKKK